MEDQIMQFEAKAKANMYMTKAQGSVSLNKLDTIFNHKVEREPERVKKTRAEALN
jgi:hypothetical protein